MTIDRQERKAMTIDKQTVEDIRFLLRQIIDCPAKRRILKALNTGTAK